MWNQLEKMSPILVGQSVFSCLDLKSIVRLETALASSEGKQIFYSFLSYYSKVDTEINLPQEITKLNWLQAHNFPISKAIVSFSNSTLLEGKLINEIELVGNNIITKKAVNSFPDSLYEKVTSICITTPQKNSFNGVFVYTFT